MEMEMTATETLSIFQKIALTTGLPQLAVELGFIILALILILIVITVVLATLRIRKEIIRLNLRIGYIARMLRQEIEGLPIKKEPERPAPEEKETFKEEWKF